MGFRFRSFLVGTRGRLETRQERSTYQAQLVIVPCAICYISFGRAFVYRFLWKPDFYDGADMTCKNYGWYNNGTVHMTCDKKALDIHATLALLWLLFFTIQAMAIRFGFKRFHMVAGLYYFFPIALLNVFGMAIMTGYDINNTSSKNPKGKEFYPFMILSK